MNNITNIGTRKKIEESIVSAISINGTDAEKIFDFLLTTYHENSSEFGCIDLNTPSGEELIFKEGQYYINLSKGLLLIIAHLLDITLTKGVISDICGMLGIQTQIFYKTNQQEGETCLLREYLRSKKDLNVQNYSYLICKECINNDLTCKYRDFNGICRIQETNIETILISFRETKIAE